jgi:hypothetical protein
MTGFNKARGVGCAVHLGMVTALQAAPHDPVRRGGLAAGNTGKDLDIAPRGRRETVEGVSSTRLAKVCFPIIPLGSQISLRQITRTGEEPLKRRVFKKPMASAHQPAATSRALPSVQRLCQLRSIESPGCRQCPTNDAQLRRALHVRHRLEKASTGLRCLCLHERRGRHAA